MKFKELENLIQTSRATRRFQKDALVTLDDLKELINIARITSSAKNMQPIKYIIVTQKEQVQKLTSTAAWAAHLKEWDQSEDERPSAFIIMLNDTSIDGFPMFDAGVSFEAISLGAKAKGLSICPMASIDKDICKELFDIPKGLEIMIGIAVGIGAENIKLVDTKDGDTNYYREADQTHCVPKRSLEEVIIIES